MYVYDGGTSILITFFELPNTVESFNLIGSMHIIVFKKLFQLLVK